MLLALALGVLATLLTPLAGATGPAALACSASAVEGALAAGGSYTISCNGAYIQFQNDAPLTSNQVTTITSTGTEAQWYDSNTLGSANATRFINVTAGSLTLTNVELIGTFYQSGAGAGGTLGTSGTQGATGTTVSGDNITAGKGGNGTNGTAGGMGGVAPAAQGAGIFISSGATVTLNGGEIEAARLDANTGGAGGSGGGGGRGGFGGQCNSGVCTGGDGGNAGSGAGGGVGGVGGVAEGGAVYVSTGGTLNVNAGTIFDSDTASGGAGGAGGNGGGGSQGGQGGQGTDGTNGGTGAAGQSAAGAVGGLGGAAQGGAIYNAGTLNITSAVFSNDEVAGGNGGTGGNGGNGGDNAVGTGGTDGSAGANGGAAAADSSGGAVYNAGTMTLIQATFTTDKAFGAPGGSGGMGGAGGGQVSGFGANGAGGNGTVGGDAAYASVYSPTAIVGCATFTGDALTAGGGGLAGAGGYNNSNSGGGTGTAGAAGAAGSTGVLDPVIIGGAACPALSVADSSVAEPSGGGTATLTFTVTLSAAQSKVVTVNYATSDGSAVAGTDYDTPTGTTLTFPAGTTTQTIAVTVHDVGYEADKTFDLTLSDPTNAALLRAQAVGTINGRSPLVATVKVAPSSIVKETATGPVPVTTTATVTLTNVGTDPITSITLPSKLTIGWHAGVTGAGASLPVQQIAAPASLTVPTLAPGQSSTPASYTLEVDGDGSLDVQALALGALGGQTIKGLGTTLFTPDSQLLVFSAKVGAKVPSQTNPALIQAGTSFLVNLALENRSYYRTIVVDPIYPGLDGNAADGAVLPASVGYTGSDPTGAESEVEASPYIEIKPRATANYLVVVRTGASDAADTQTAVSGGTHATVTFDPPDGVIVGANNTTSAYDPAKYAVLTPGSDQLDVGIDDSGMTAAPWAASNPLDWASAVWSVSKGLTWGLWRATYGTVRGILWDLPSLIVKGVYNISTASLDYLDRMVELWSACGKDPSCEYDLVNTVVDKIIDSYAQAPELLTQTAAQLKTQVDMALTSHFAKLEAEWDAGDWQDALTEFTAEGTDTAINVALMLGPAVLARSPKAAAAWNTLKTATYAKIDGALAATVRALEPAKAAFLALSDVIKPGYWFTEDQMASLFGVSDTESSLLSAFTKRLGISVVLRSRASEAIEYLEKGLAVMKPYWIKTKNVNELDVKFLGYTGGTGADSELGRVVFRKLPPQATVEARMRANGIDPADPEWSQVLSRLKTRVKEYNGEYKQMQKWNKAGKVRGKWPWGENGVNPAVQADTYSTVRFRLNTQGGAVIPEIWSEGKWKFITGDIDLIAITKANGSALSDTEHVAILKQLSNIIGAQHPESATWINDGKFWFTAKENYLTNEGACCLAQYGPDGKIRAVQFNQGLSDPTSWTKLNYRIFWNGGYQAGPGG